MAKEKNFIKSYCKKVETQFGELINLDISMDDLVKLKRTSKGFVRLTIAQRKEKGQYGETHYVYENEYVKEEKKEDNYESKLMKEDSDILPF